MGGRTLSGAMLAALSQAITGVGYFLQLNLSTIHRWSNIGQQTWNGQTWLDRPFKLSGIDFNADAELVGTIEIDNRDGVAGAIFTNPAEPVYAGQITAYQFERTALGVSDVPLIATLAISGLKVNPDVVRISVTELATYAQFAPVRTISPHFGFNFATPAGQTIDWNGERYVTEPYDG